MLYLGGGMRQVKVGEHQTLYVFPDFSDKQQFYYLPNFPQIAKMEDGSPAIRLLVYREDLDEHSGHGTGCRRFPQSRRRSRVAAGSNRERGEQAARRKMPWRRSRRLTPIFFSKGSVKLMLLDAATPDDDATQPPGAVKPSQFVTSIMGAGSPSLYGDNRAIFQASLSKKGAAALSGALDGVTPIGVVYSLTFAGLQPAFHIKAKVDWQKVYDHFSERENADFLFYESDIQKSIDKLVEEKVIDIDVTVEGMGAEAMDAEREAGHEVDPAADLRQVLRSHPEADRSRRWRHRQRRGRHADAHPSERADARHRLHLPQEGSHDRGAPFAGHRLDRAQGDSSGPSIRRRTCTT